MQRRAPVWFTHGKAREQIYAWWPWAMGFLLGGLYWYQPEPFEEVRVASLAAVRRPVLRGSEWLEVRDVDPETFALELPPDQLFGPLPLEQQMEFVLAALKDDNELADGYVTRLVIDQMDLSLDPAHLGTKFVECGADRLLDFAVDDLLERRPPPAKNRFFDGDRFLRLLTICANQPPLVEHFLKKHDGIDLVFRALGESTNEYARVLAARALTLFAMQQKKDGVVEKAILQQGHLPALIDLYRQSTGDPTDTRFSTMLLSSILRQHPKESYEACIENNLVAAAVTNLNMSRYKGLPHHIRILHDLEATRLALYGKAKPSSQPKTRLPQDAPKRTRLQAMMAPSDEQQKIDERINQRMKAADAATTEADRLRAEAEGEAAEQQAALRLPPPKDLRASIPQLMHDADMLPVALGVLDVFPEYFEATRELLKLVNSMRDVTPAMDFLECRALGVTAKLVARHSVDPSFEAEGVAGELETMVRWVMADKECQPWMDPTAKHVNREMAQALKECNAFLSARAEEPVVPAAA